MKLTDLLKGKVVIYKTDALIDVELEIEDVEEVRHSRDLEPATPQNDWWPKTENWTTLKVKFKNGFIKTFNNLNEIRLKDEKNI